MPPMAIPDACFLGEPLWGLLSEEQLGILPVMLLPVQKCGRWNEICLVMVESSQLI